MSFRLVFLLFAITPFPLSAAPKKQEVESVSFSIERGYYTEPFEVVLSTETPEASIIYTADGTTPSKTNGVLVAPESKATVEVAQTTILRAMAIKEALEPSPIETHTYLFVDDILNQKSVASWSPEIDQGMNPEVFETKTAMQEAKDVFHRVPTVSVLTDAEGLFGEEGIYIDPKKRGRASELSASVEWIDPNEKGSLQVSCGLRIQGAGSRTQSRKKNFRLRFAKEFGAGKFSGDLFKEKGPEEFENLILRNPTHDSWAVYSHTWRNNARYVNDAWAAQTQRLMGNLSARQRWVHLFLNGRYWGVYALTERPDEHFASSHLEKKSDDLIIYNARELQSGEKTRLDEAKTFITTQLTNTKKSFAELDRYLDVDAFIDHFIVNVYAANVDWPDRNFFLIGEKSENPYFRFVGWDAETGFFRRWDSLRNRHAKDALGFDQVNDTKMLFDGFGPGLWYRALTSHPEFRLRFSDRLYQHVSLGGLLSPTQASLRYRRLLNEIEPLLLLEGARWGDAINKDSPFLVHNVKWQKLTSPDSWLFTKFFPRRSMDLIEDFQKYGVFPKILPPKLGRPPSRMIKKNEKTIYLENPNETGIIIFTTDGTDPREAWTGKILGPAYRNPLRINEGEKVMARVYSERKWSALMVSPRSNK